LLGFFISGFGDDEDTIKKYVEHQNRQDSGQVQMKLYDLLEPKAFPRVSFFKVFSRNDDNK
jgi:hypothetical protein